MKTTVTKNDFIDAIKSIRPDNFTYPGLAALFDYLEDYEEACEAEIEFDPIAICCEFTQYALDELEPAFSHLNDDGVTSVEDWLELLQCHTSIIQVSDNALIIADF